MWLFWGHGKEERIFRRELGLFLFSFVSNETADISSFPNSREQNCSIASMKLFANRTRQD